MVVLSLRELNQEKKLEKNKNTFSGITLNVIQKKLDTWSPVDTDKNI